MQRMACCAPIQFTVEAGRQGNGRLPIGAVELIDGVDITAGMRHGCIELVQAVKVGRDSHFSKSRRGWMDACH
jgi:hypothetical protein